MLVSQSRLETIASTISDDQVLGVIHGSKSAYPTTQRFQQLSQLIQAILLGLAQDDLIKVATLQALSAQEVEGTASGQPPHQTLQRASDPGMRLQSVSVAQSPQIAMALR